MKKNSEEYMEGLVDALVIMHYVWDLNTAINHVRKLMGGKEMRDIHPNLENLKKEMKLFNEV